MITSTEGQSAFLLSSHGLQTLLLSLFYLSTPFFFSLAYTSKYLCSDNCFQAKEIHGPLSILNEHQSHFKQPTPKDRIE